MSYVISGWNLEPCLIEATAWALREMAKWTKEKRHIGRFGREAQELAAKFMERQPHQPKKRKLQQVEEPIFWQRILVLSRCLESPANANLINELYRTLLVVIFVIRF